LLPFTFDLQKKFSTRQKKQAGRAIRSYLFCPSFSQIKKRITATIPYALAQDSHFARGNFSQFESINFFVEF